MADRVLDVKLDLLGSSLELGLTDYRRTSGIIRGIVRNLRNDRNDVAQAIEDATRIAGDFHHSVENLPLASVRAVKFGPKKALVRLRYQYSPFRSSFGSLPAFTTIQTRGFSARTPVYKAATLGGEPKFKNGLPDGGILGFSGQDITDPDANRPQPWIYSRPAVRIIVTTHLNVNPMSDVIEAIKKMNSDSVTFAGKVFGATVIMFDAVNVDWNIAERSGRSARTVRLFFNVTYVFTAISGGHFLQRLYKPGERLPNGSLATFWIAINELAGEAVDFAGAFPVHA